MVGFGFSVKRLCFSQLGFYFMVFSGVSFSFSHRSSNTLAAAICFGAQAFSHMGFGREGEED